MCVCVCERVLRGEQLQLGLDAAVSHAHPRQRRADVLGGAWTTKQEHND